MNINKMIKSWPFLFFILLALTGLLLSGLLIQIWVTNNKEVVKEVDLIKNRTSQEIWSVVQRTTTTLLSMNSSATNLAKVVAASLGKTDLTFSHIKTKVAPLLFQALLTIPRVSQISYIGNDGLFFALCSQPNQQIVAIYSNTSFSEATRARTNYSWYTQRVDPDTGKSYGEIFKFPTRILVNKTWLQQALNTTHGYASLGKSWNDDNNMLVLNSARVDKNGVISLGFELKLIVDAFKGVLPFGVGLYLATKDGRVLCNEIPNTSIVVDENTTVAFNILKADGDPITLRFHYEIPEVYVFDISGTRYILYTSSLDIIGLQSVYVLALPYGGTPSNLHKETIFMLVILVVIFVTITIFGFILVMLIVIAARKEMCLRSDLIKQKEATQQAERKSKNKSLAFVYASHDIRASLAGITGLLEMLINDVDNESELAKNLRLMQKCSEDLHSILNSILDTSKIEAGKMQLEEKPFDLVKVLEGVVDLFYHVGLVKGVDVILDLQDGSLTKFSQVNGDEGRLKQIISNLLSNAIKFTTEGYISVRARAMKPKLQNPTFDSPHYQKRRCWSRFFSKNDAKCGNFEATDEVDHDHNFMEFMFEVDDTGKGIPKEKQASIFENYVRVKETECEIEGTGLGLGIVRSLVRLMGGEISIVDKKVGERGTCFRFNAVFKVSQADLHGVSEDEKIILSSGSNTPFYSTKHAHNSSTVVLFISGDERRKMTQRFLQAHGLKVFEVKNIQQLSETLKRFGPEQKNNTCSTRSDLNSSFGYLTWVGSQDSNTSPKDVPLSALDWTNSSPDRRPDVVTESSFLLLVIDTTQAHFRELRKVVAEFRKDSKKVSFRVVWLGIRCMQVHGLNEKQLPPSDIIIPMPLHGSRLHSLIDLLPESGGTLPYTRPQGSQRTPTQDQMQEITRILPSVSSPLRGKKVLLVEDDSLQQVIAIRVLVKQRVMFDTCANGKEALTLVSKGLTEQRNLGASHILPYEYILMDCQMPVMDGCKATRQIRLMEKEYGVHIPIIGLTAHEKGEELNKLILAGIDIHVIKPLNEHKLLKVIEDLHSRK